MRQTESTVATQADQLVKDLIDGYKPKQAYFKKHGYVLFTTPIIEENSEEAKQQSMALWNQLQKQSQCVIALNTSAPFNVAKIENFQTFDYWLRVDHIPGEEFWYKPIKWYTPLLQFFSLSTKKGQTTMAIV